MPSWKRSIAAAAAQRPDNSLGTAMRAKTARRVCFLFAVAIIIDSVRRSLKAARTEQQNPRSKGLDRKTTVGVLRALNREDASVALAVRGEIPKLAKAVDAIVAAFRAGGRLIYVGAGTSGRLAVADAAECPPTFGTPPKMVQAIVAGGSRAFRYAVEGAEDSASAGARDLSRAEISKRDVVVGLSASGTTPYVLGALQAAREEGAVTVGVTANRRSPLAKRAAIAIVPETGPEALAGSTRLKAGTAQKMVLNLLSTASMVRLGKVYGSWMVHLALTNRKLRQRGIRILQEAADVNPSQAEHALRQASNSLPAALVMLKTGADSAHAREWLSEAGGNVRRALIRSERHRTGRKMRD
jgi:N-acetylmuramic acid 6-phosphate etherase